MKTKSFFLSNLLGITVLLVLIFSISTNQAQSWKNLKKKVNETIEKVKNDPQVKKITKKLDPTDYIVKQINKNTNLDNYYYNITSKFKQIDYYLDQNTTLDNFQPGLYQKSFIKAKYTPEAGKMLMYDNSLIYNIPVSIDNQKFNLFQSNDQALYIESIDKSSSPVGEKLENIILISYYTPQISTLNSSFLKNLKGFSNAQAETYGALLIFYDKTVQSFDTLLNLSYAGVSANDVLSSYFKLMKLGYSYSGFETKIRNFRDELKTFQRLSLEVNQSAGDILSTMNKMKNNQNLSVAEINYSIQGFKKIAQNTNILTDEIHEKYESFKNVQKQFARLSNFYGIFFIESIGRLYGKLGDYILKIENKTRDYSNQLNSFVNEIETASADMYDASYKKLTENMLKQYQSEHDIVNNLTTLNNDILEAKWYK
ncbi:MAG: hypothetical protein KAT48_12110, partial [Bacteroidales bacterium]|nr:hypothetical protein [Bacteroidales bacterium]